MGRFILRKRTASEVASLATPRRSMRPVERRRQVEELAMLRRSESPNDDLVKWLGDTVREKVVETEALPEMAKTATRVRSAKKKAAAPRARARARVLYTLPITGFAITEAPTDLDKMRRDLPDYDVFEDKQISLIQPMPTSSVVASADTSWIRNLTGVREARAAGLTGAGVTVAVLDTGIDATHPELAGRVTLAVSFDATNGSAIAMAASADTHYHGTHVAGTLAGATVGMAPGASLVAVVMIPQGTGWFSDFVAAMEWAAGQPEVQIVNMSAGLHGFHPEMLGAARDLLQVGVLPVFAVGNEGRGTSRSPGNYEAPVSVGACDGNRKVASFSGGGTIVVDNHQHFVPDLVAPGVDVYSCVPQGQFRSLEGTSMATPVVAAVAALLLEKHPNATSLDLIDALLTSCVDLGYPEDRQGRGLVSFVGADARLS